MKVGFTEGRWSIKGRLVRLIGRVFLTFACVIVFILLCGVGWWISANISSQREEASLKQRWAEIGRPFEEILGRFPPRVANESARRLEELAAPLGIQLTPRGVDDRVTTEQSSIDSFDGIKDMVQEHCSRIAGADHVLEENLSADLESFLTSNTDALDSVVQHLLNEETPMWEQDVRLAESAPSPNFLGQIYLTRLLVVRSSLLVRQGHPAEAEEALEAAWNLQRAAAQRPETISQLIGVAEARFIAGGVRNHPKLTAEWSDRLLEHDYRESILDAFHFEAWTFCEITHDGDPFGGNALVRVISKPYLRNQAVLNAEAIRSAIESLPGTALAGYDPGEAYAVALENIPEGIVARIALPDVWSFWNRVCRSMLDLELSATALELRRAAASEGLSAWTQLPAEQASRLFPSVTWRFTLAGRSLRIEPVQELPAMGSVSLENMCEAFVLELPIDR
ncbi:MAG: hypothetical protein GY906_36580 [bacterium]|nr:hypothetical protein [bacterium]